MKILNFMIKSRRNFLESLILTFFSLEFTLIFFVFFLAYWALASNFKFQNGLILIANYAFICSFSPVFALVLAFHTFFVSYFGLYIVYKKRLDALLFGLFFTLAYLCFFKYFDVLQSDFKELLLFFKFDLLARNLEVVFPIGISFYTFTSITYLVAVYQKRHKPAPFLTLACYLSFFATLLAGRICRSEFMLPQFKRERKFGDGDKIFALILLGVVKKALIANYLQGYVDGVFSDASSFNSVQILTAIFSYGVWIYCDFSGYVNIVTALALALGFTLPPNFDMPYASLNLREFWRRWHISLSFFIRDYVYIPLGGSRCGFFRTQLNLVIAFALSGVWHGVGWGFLVWGLLHGLGIVWLNLMSKIGVSISRYLPFLSRFFTYIFVSVAWVYFARPEISDANEILLAACANFKGVSLQDWFALGLFWIAFFAYPYFDDLEFGVKCALNSVPTVITPALLAAIFCAIFAVMPDGVPSFIYSSF